MPLNQVAEEICKVNVVRQNQKAKKKEGKGREKKRYRNRLSKALKQAETEQPLISMEIGKVVKFTAEETMSSSFQAADVQGPPSKRARRSAEVRSSCPWDADLPKPTWRSSEAMRKSGRPTNVKGSKMLPMGPLRCYSREMIKVEQKWTREVGEGGGYVGGFIDDVVNGERLLVDRPAKEFAYYTLRQGTQGVLEGSHQVEADEIPLMNQGHVV